MQHNGATYRRYVIFGREQVYTQAQHRGATYRCYLIFQQRINDGAYMQHRGYYLLSLFHFRVRYPELLLKEVASKHQESRRTRPTTLDKLMMEKITEVAAGMLRTTTGSKRTHGKTGVEQQKRIKSVRSMTGLVTNIFLFYSIGCFLSC
jgi:hypothetical protein